MNNDFIDFPLYKYCMLKFSSKINSCLIWLILLYFRQELEEDRWKRKNFYKIFILDSHSYVIKFRKFFAWTVFFTYIIHIYNKKFAVLSFLNIFFLLFYKFWYFISILWPMQLILWVIMNNNIMLVPYWLLINIYKYTHKYTIRFGFCQYGHKIKWRRIYYVPEINIW